ncbi:hypothetical protein NLI96_g5601 [Meripilus lineatus]|uniref:Uncharacterized protein n=1 Tax=Meripilus lineatus TaxID=2056292 RepID=A0AAD5V2M8_9APHY|nr:hypothetical protein NLI96_g5601 [Physisporinus lineatus]
MTYSAGLILVIVTSLSVGQFVIEYLDESPNDPHSRRDSENIKEPLLDSPTSYEHQVALHPLYRTYSHSKSASVSSLSSTSSQADTLTTSLLSGNNNNNHNNKTPSSGRSGGTRPRSKSKPTSIFIHPTQSNIARADAAAQQLGLSGDTELVKECKYPEGDVASWEMGTGRDVARELLGSRKNTL